jgi:HK97 family phage portal protein
MLGKLFGGGSQESRTISYNQAWDTGLINAGNSTWSGSPVTPETAVSLSTAFACIQLYADTVSTLPVATFRRVDGERKPTARPMWLDEPDIGVTWQQYIGQGIRSYFMSGDWIARVYRNPLGETVAIVLLDPARVDVRRNVATGRIEYFYDQGKAIAQSDVIHLMDFQRPTALRGESRAVLLKQSFGLAQALLEHASRFFSNGSETSGIIEMPQVLNAEQALEVARAYENRHKGLRKSNRIGVLGGGAKWIKTGVDPEDAQALESRAASIEEVARIYRVPPPKIGITTPGSMSYASVEQLQIGWTQDSVRPLVQQIEVAHSRLLPRGEFVRINIDGLLRGDTATRYTAYSTALLSGWAAINDVRSLEDMPKVPGGDGLRVPLANVDLPAANIVEQEKNVAMAVQLIAAGADPAATLAAFGLPAIPFVEPVAPMPVSAPVDDTEDDTEETP